MSNRGPRGGQRGRGSSGSRGTGGRGTEPAPLFQQQDSQQFSVSAITNLENRFFQPGSVEQLRDLKLDDRITLPIRPGYGDLGKEITLYTNSFELLIKDSKPIYKFSVSILVANSEQEPKGRKRARLIALLLGQLAQHPLLATDGSGIIISNSKFVTDSAEYDVPYYREDQEAHHAVETYKVRIDYSATLDLNDLTACLNSTDLNRWQSTDFQDWIQVLNIAIGHNFKAARTEIIARQNKYFPYNRNNRFTQKVALNPFISAHRGFFVSSRPATGRPLLNVQVKHIAVWEPKPLSEVLSLLGKTSEGRAIAPRLIAGLRVKLTHLDHGRIKKVAGFATPSDGRSLDHPPKVDRHKAGADTVFFWKDDEKKYVSVQEYFKKTYRLSSPFPVINLGTRDKPSYYPAEVCRIVDGETVRCQLGPEETAAMIGFAVRAPNQNASTIAGNGVGLIKQYSGQTLAGSGIIVGDSLVKVNARLLIGPNVEYAKSKVVQPRGASWNMMNTAFSQGASLPNWAVLWLKIIPPKDSGRSFNNTFSDIADLKQCVDNFGEVLRKSGLRPGPMSPIRELVIEQEDRCQQAINERFQLAAQYNVRLLLVVLPSTNAMVYNTVKKAGDITHGVNTICVTGSVFGRDRHKDLPPGATPNVQTFANLALKFNLKLGGCNQQLSRSDLDFIVEGKTMLVGLDVTHPAPGQVKAPSVAAIVASVDNRLGQWPADIRVQQRRQEMVQALEEMFIGRLKLWQKHNRSALPDEILIYRDGVSEGQYGIVLETELPQIRKACEKVYPATQTKSGLPRLTIVIVGKRHHTRFYPTTTENADSKGNNKNGTVIDRGVTEACLWDFYLQAHTALHGTARPAHYVVVHDEIFRKRHKSAPGATNTLWKVTHNLCYLFGRATKAVSICPPAYYADIACERARCWLSRVFDDTMTASSGEGREISSDETKVHERLRDTMFYI